MNKMSELTVMNLPVVLNRLPNGNRFLWGFNLSFPDQILFSKIFQRDLVFFSLET